MQGEAVMGRGGWWAGLVLSVMVLSAGCGDGPPRPSLVTPDPQGPPAVPNAPVEELPPGDAPLTETPDAGDPDGGAPASEAGSLDWARRFGTGEQDSAADIAVDPEGDLVLVGTFAADGFDLGGGALPNPRGPDEAGASPDLFVAKLTPDGSHRWSRGFGGPDAYTAGRHVAVDPSDGSIYVGGLYGGRPLFDAWQLPYPGQDGGAFLLKLSGDGAVQWVKAYFAPRGVLGTSLPPRPAVGGGRVYQALSVRGTVEVEGHPLQCGPEHRCSMLLGYRADGHLDSVQTLGGDSADVHINALRRTRDGGLLLILELMGRLELQGAFLEVAEVTTAVVRLGETGAHQWHRLLVTEGSDSRGYPGVGIGTLRLGPDDSVLVGGAFTHPFTFAGQAHRPGGGDVEAFVALYGPEGEERWARTTQGHASSLYTSAGTTSVEFGDEGRVYVVGSLDGVFDFCGTQMWGGTDWVPTNAGPWNFFVAALEADGRCLWTRDYTPHAFALAAHAAVHVPRSGLYLVGDVLNQFEAGGLTSDGYADALLMHVRP
jgi:hypothetical protein